MSFSPEINLGSLIWVALLEQTREIGSIEIGGYPNPKVEGLI
jgi:hypothetical protein